MQGWKGPWDPPVGAVMHLVSRTAPCAGGWGPTEEQHLGAGQGRHVCCVHISSSEFFPGLPGTAASSYTALLSGLRTGALAGCPSSKPETRSLWPSLNSHRPISASSNKRSPPPLQTWASSKGPAGLFPPRPQWCTSEPLCDTPLPCWGPTGALY